MNSPSKYIRNLQSNNNQIEDSVLSEEDLLVQEEPDPPLEKEPEKTTKLIRLTRSFRTRWDLFTMLLAVYNCFTVPFFVAFDVEEGLLLFFINTSIDFMFMVDIVLNFLTTYVDTNGDEVMDMRKIAKNYIYGQFCLDFVASLPVDNFWSLFSERNTATRILGLTDMLKLIRVLRLGRIVRFTRAKDDVKAVYNLMQLLLYLIIWVHLQGCVWFIIVKQNKEWVPVPDFLVGSTDLYEESIWMQYFTIFYHAVWLLKGNELAPRDTLQAFVCSVLIICGGLITAVMFGEMAVLMSNLSRRSTEFQENLDGALTTMSNMKLPSALTNSILDYITSTQSSLDAQNEYETFQKFISPSLQQEVAACIYDPIIKSNEVFQNEPQLTKELVHLLSNRFSSPEDDIVTEMQESDAMYFLVNGEAQVIVTGANEVRHTVCYLYPGAHFGEVGLIYNLLRTATVMGLGYCNVAILSKEDFQALDNQYQGFTTKLKAWCNNYRDPWREYLVSMILQANYLYSMGEEEYYELVYIMDMLKLEKGNYLFKPGDECNTIYLITSGTLELSYTFSDKNVHLLKKAANMQDIENGPKIPKTNTTLADFLQYHYPMNQAGRLKKKAEIIPIIDQDENYSSISLEDECPFMWETIGNYPQEVVLEELPSGSLLFPHVALLSMPHVLQCKALEATTVYKLDVSTLEAKAKSNSDFKKEMQSAKKRMTQSLDYLDYSYIEEPSSNRTKKLFRNAIIKSIINKREQKRKGSSQLAIMVPKLQAIIAAENAQNFELAERVVRGEIPPHHVLENGQLDPLASTPAGAASIPRRHPILKTFSNVFSEFNSEESLMRQNYLHATQIIGRSNQKLQMLKVEFAEFQQRLIKVLQALDGQPNTGNMQPEEFKKQETLENYRSLSASPGTPVPSGVIGAAILPEAPIEKTDSPTPPQNEEPEQAQEPQIPESNSQLFPSIHRQPVSLNFEDDVVQEDFESK